MSVDNVHAFFVPFIKNHKTHNIQGSAAENPTKSRQNFIIMKNIKIICIILGVLLCGTSCMTTRTSVGSYNQAPGQTYQYSKGKQCYLFWGLIPLGRTSIATPEDGVCQVRTKFNFVDWLVSGLTGGIFSMQSIRVYAKRPAEPNDIIVGDIVVCKQGKNYVKVTVESIIDEKYCTVRFEDGKIKKCKFADLSK